VRPRGWFAWGWSWLLSIRRALRTEMPAAAAAASWLLPPRRFVMNKLRWGFVSGAGIPWALRIGTKVSGSHPTGQRASRQPANFIVGGHPGENGFAESFNGRFGDEFLNTEQFTTAPEAQILTDRWRWEYNTLRLHSALQGRTPLEAAQQGAAA